MPLYIVNVGKKIASRKESANESFVAALTSLHAENFHTNPSMIRIEFRYLDFDYHGRFVSHAEPFIHSEIRHCYCTDMENVGWSRFPALDRLF